MRWCISFVFSFFMIAVLCAGSASAARMVPLDDNESRPVIKIYTPPSLPPPTKNVYEIIAANKNLSKFVAMVNEAGLKELLSANTGESVTVFAPSDSAIADASHDVMKRVQADKTSLQSFVKYHIIAGSMVSSGAIKHRRAALATANGETLSFDGMDPKSPKVGDGSLVQADIMATNGIVHIVSGALVPPSLAQAPVAKPQVPPPAPPVAATPPAAPAAPAVVSAPTAPAAPTAVKITTTGVAKAPAATMETVTTGNSADTVTSTDVVKAPAKALKALTTTSNASVTTTGTAVAPAVATPLQQSTTANSGSFELFGHKFGW